jgi:hypothetical protein
MSPSREPLEPHDRAVVAAQLGRPPRGARAVAHRCPCGCRCRGDVAPPGRRHAVSHALLPDLSACDSGRGRLESAGLMREMSARLGKTAISPRDTKRPTSATSSAVRRSRRFLRSRESRPEDADPVKCLHVHLAQSLAEGPGSNPFGDEVFALGRSMVDRRALRHAVNARKGTLPRLLATAGLADARSSRSRLHTHTAIKVPFLAPEAL